MTTYTTIPNGDIDTDSPITTSLMTLMRDNPIAITEGASGAPRIARAAIAAGVGHRWFFDYGDGSDGAITHSATASIAPGLYQCTTFQINATYTITLNAMGPLIICATTSITINGTLDVDGMGARGGRGATTQPAGLGEAGLFGGSGGGGDVAGATSGSGGDTYLTAGGIGSSTPTAGSAQSTRTKATLLSLMPIIRVRPYYATAASEASGSYKSDNITALASGSRGDCGVGGGGGGGSSNSSSNHGGAGGGLVVLIAPIITVGASGVITADGVSGTGDAGGGGGGAIIIATPAGGYTNSGSVAAAAGTAPAAGGAGGAGWVEAITI